MRAIIQFQVSAVARFNLKRYNLRLLDVLQLKRTFYQIHQACLPKKLFLLSMTVAVGCRFFSLSICMLMRKSFKKIKLLVGHQKSTRRCLLVCVDSSNSHLIDH